MYLYEKGSSIFTYYYVKIFYAIEINEIYKRDNKRNQLKYK